MVTGPRRGLMRLLVLIAFSAGLVTVAHTFAGHEVPGPPMVMPSAAGQPLTAVSALDSACRGDTLELHLTWATRAPSGVAGYRVRMYTEDGDVLIPGVIPAATTRYDGRSVRANGQATTYQFTVTTMTDHGGTTESPRTAAITC